MTISEFSALPQSQQYGAIARILAANDCDIQAGRWIEAERGALDAENLYRAQQHLGPLAGGRHG